jgi:hypothetical protein
MRRMLSDCARFATWAAAVRVLLAVQIDAHAADGGQYFH